MSIENPADWPLDGSEVGADLWPLLNRLEAAIVSNYANASRAPEIADGGLWSREESDGTHSLVMYSAGRNVALLRTTTAGAARSQWFYTKTEVDNLIEEVTGEIAAISGIPIGGIILWSGSISAIPAGWALCNGSQGTPNLRDRFIVGAGGSYAVGANGGQDAITEVPRHSHSFSATTGSSGGHNHGGKTTAGGQHNHQWFNQTSDGGSTDTIDTVRAAGTYRVYDASGNERYINDQTQLEGDYYTGNARNGSAGGAHAHDIPAVGGHTHAVTGTTGNAGSTSVDIRPRYYALAYLMRVQ